MKTKDFLLGLLAGLALLIGVAATVQYTGNIYVLNTDTAVPKLKLRTTGAAQSAAWFDCVDTNGVKFSLPASGIVPTTYGGTGVSAASASATMVALGVHSGTVTTADDGTVTNTFSPIFSASPVLVIAQTGTACTVSNIVTLTKSNFVFNAGSPAIVAKWVAVGAP